jgi:ATP-dependent RNA helicase SUPV3L1/SUV3
VAAPIEAASAVEAETASQPSTQDQPADVAPPAEAAPSSASSDVASSESPSKETASAAVEAPAEPEMIEVWRPGRFDHKPRHQGRPRPRRQDAPRNGAAAHTGSVAAPDGAASANAVPKEGERPHRREERRFPKRTGGEGERPAGFQQGRGSQRDNQRGEQRGDRRGKDNFRKDRDRHGGDAPRSFGPPRERRDKAPDPDSPFAKLAALKAQLEGKDPS